MQIGSTYGDVEEELPDKMLKLKGEVVIIMLFCDANMCQKSDFIQGIYLVVTICSFINLKEGLDFTKLDFGAVVNFTFACLA